MTALAASRAAVAATLIVGICVSSVFADLTGQLFFARISFLSIAAELPRKIQRSQRSVFSR